MAADTSSAPAASTAVVCALAAALAALSVDWTADKSEAAAESASGDAITNVIWTPPDGRDQYVMPTRVSPPQTIDRSAEISEIYCPAAVHKSKFSWRNSCISHIF